MEAVDILKKASLRQTPFRLKVLELFRDSPHAAIRNQDIELQLGKHDRITLYRTLISFEKSGIIHKVMDNTSEVKYALCHQECKVHMHSKEHAHFSCDSCGVTYCLDTKGDVNISLPENYSLGKIQIAVSGTCAGCH